MKRFLVFLVIAAVLAALAFLAWQMTQSQEPATATAQTVTALPTASEPVLPPIGADGRVVADAVVVPTHSAHLSLPAGGIVAELLVQQGDPVLAGQPLLRLENAREQAGVTQAEATLRRTEAALAEVQAGPRPQEIEAARASVDAAQAQLASLEEGARPEEVAAAEAALDGARASLQKVLDGTPVEQVIAARAELENAAATLSQAQAAYDRVSWREDIGRLPEALQLQQATNAYNASEARLEELERGASQADIAAAQAQVRQAQAQLDNIQAPARASALAASAAELRRAQAQLDLLAAGPRPESIAMAEAEVASAQAALDQARAALDDTQLRAPFAGTVVEILPAVGEQVGPGTPVVRLADLTNWQIETDDLTEFSVFKVQEGDPATITFDAIPGLELSGTVQRVDALGVNKQGDITYTVVVVPDRFDDRLRWNMTAVVSIQPSNVGS